MAGKARVCFENLATGEWGGCRPDVLSLEATNYSLNDPRVYEVKVTRGDFLSDIRSRKWERYLQHCARFFFATPEGLVDKSEVPKPAGLLIRHEHGWRHLKRAEHRPRIKISDFMRNKLACYGERYRTEFLISRRQRREWLEHLKRREFIGDAVAKAAQELHEAK